jgi:hypothetical protein
VANVISLFLFRLRGRFPKSVRQFYTLKSALILYAFQPKRRFSVVSSVDFCRHFSVPHPYLHDRSVSFRLFQPPKQFRAKK